MLDDNSKPWALLAQRLDDLERQQKDAIDDEWKKKMKWKERK